MLRSTASRDGRVATDNKGVRPIREQGEMVPAWLREQPFQDRSPTAVCAVEMLLICGLAQQFKNGVLSDSAENSGRTKM
jgi:hypothetical protein